MKRWVILILVVACSHASGQVDSKKVGESSGTKPTTAPSTKPAVVHFDVAGMHIGDPCESKDRGKPEMFCKLKTIEVGTGSVGVGCWFKDDKLIGVMLSFDSKLFPALVKTYTKKFGTPPAETTTTPVQLRVGKGSYVNETVVWNTTDGPFTLKKYTDTIAKGNGILLTPEFDQAMKAKEKAGEEELKKKL